MSNPTSCWTVGIPLSYLFTDPGARAVEATSAFRSWGIWFHIAPGSDPQTAPYPRSDNPLRRRGF